MDHPASPHAQLIGTLVSFAIIGIVLFFRMRRMTRERPLKIEQLWIVPAIYLVVAGFVFWNAPPRGITIALCVLAAVVGAGLGWQRGRMMRITVDPETHAISQKGSLAAMLFLLALIGIRTLAREAAIFEGASWHLDVMAITDVLVALALGLLTAQRVEMYLRARRLLEAARAA